MSRNTKDRGTYGLIYDVTIYFFWFWDTGIAIILDFEDLYFSSKHLYKMIETVYKTEQNVYWISLGMNAHRY